MAAAARAQNEEDCLRLAIEVAQPFVKAHINNAVYFYYQRIATLFEAVGTHDQAHPDQLCRPEVVARRA